jgi:Type I restriction-modification system methyltransferase subunit
MQWIAPSEKDAAQDTLEKRLWDAADQFRANSGLTSAQYSAPVLGLIFLRFAESRFDNRRAELEAAGASSRRGTSRVDDPAAYHAAGVMYLPETARFAHLLNMPEGENIGQAINEAMAAIERDNPQLAGVLPRSYQLFTSTLLKEILKKISEIPVSLEFDAFGRIYEYFLGEFARTEGQKGGEFYTPSSIVRLLVEVLEPFHGKVLDPACGSGGMFVQSARFVSEHHKSAADELFIHGVEKTDETGRLARMNLAIHGLEGDIRHGGHINSYYDDPHSAVGSFDFVLANPPFNVNAVDKERLESEVGAGRRFPFGLPRTDNANYLWIQLFYSSLNEKGRAGFVMANSASDARASEMELRRQLIEAKAVDVMVAVGPNMFYTVTLPCTLWFLDKGKRGTDREDKVLFIDARHIYRQIDRTHRDWTEGQLGFIANIVRLYRGEEIDLITGDGEAEAKLKEVFGDTPAYQDIPGSVRPPRSKRSKPRAGA